MIEIKRKVLLNALVAKKVALYNGELSLNEFIKSFNDVGNNDEERLYVYEYVLKSLKRFPNIVIENGKVISKTARYIEQKKSELASSEIVQNIQGTIKDIAQSQDIDSVLESLNASSKLLKEKISKMDEIEAPTIKQDTLYEVKSAKKCKGCSSFIIEKCTRLNSRGKPLGEYEIRCNETNRIFWINSEKGLNSISALNMGCPKLK